MTATTLHTLSSSVRNPAATLQGEARRAYRQIRVFPAPRWETTSADARVIDEIAWLWLESPSFGDNPLAPYFLFSFKGRLALLPSDVTALSSELGILEWLYKALRLVEECFPKVDALRLETEGDPETDERWITVEMTISGRIDQFLEQYDRYVEQWVASTPWPERDKIRLSYNLI